MIGELFNKLFGKNQIEEELKKEAAADRKTIEGVKKTIHIIEEYKKLGFDMSGCWYTCPVKLYDKVMEEINSETV